MQITSLYIDNYKLLKKFHINFRKERSILIGINGSGKSTILECIVQIFSDAYLKAKSKFGFTITYELRLEEILTQTATTAEFKTDYIKVEISASKQAENLIFRINDKVEKISEIEKYFGNFEKILPSNVVIYYAGLSERIQAICTTHEIIQQKEFYHGNFNAQNPFFYYRPDKFNLLFLALLSYEFGDIPSYLHSLLNMTELYGFSISLKRPDTNWAKGKKAADYWGAKGVLREFCQALNSFAKYTVIESEDLINFSFVSLGRLYELKNHYGEEKKVFELLEMAAQEGLLKNINIGINKGKLKQSSIPHDDEIYVNSENLSEGEQQMLVIKAMIELMLAENTLFVFDEPDTYLHPSWQRNFISEIEKNANNAHFLITTHSPQLLSNANPAEVEVQIIEDGEVVKITPKYYGRDISTILYELMGVERRNKHVAKLLSVLFDLIEDEALNEANIEYDKLAELLGEDDPAIIRAKVQLDYLQEDKNEAHT